VPLNYRHNDGYTYVDPLWGWRLSGFGFGLADRSDTLQRNAAFKMILKNFSIYFKKFAEKNYDFL